jgi:hypothetical protein
MRTRLLGVTLAVVIALWGALAITPSISAQEQGGHIWLTIEGGEYEGNHTDPWINESWVFPIKYEPNETVQFNLTVENRGEESVDTFVLIAIRGNTTQDDMAQISVQGGSPGVMTFTLADFAEVDFNPFYLNLVSAGSHGVYPPSSNATWVTYPVGWLEGIGSGNNVSTLPVEVTLGPEPSEIFVVHSDGYGLDSNGEQNYWSPNGHDTTLMLEEENGKGKGKGHGKNKKDEGSGQTPDEDPDVPGDVPDNPPDDGDVTEDPPTEDPTETPDPPISQHESPDDPVEMPLTQNDESVDELNDVSETEADEQKDCKGVLTASAIVALIASILLLAWIRKRR